MISRATAGRAIVAAAAFGACALGLVVHLRDAGAQRLDPRRPAVFVVGAPGGASPTIRGDARRTGSSKDLLPAGVLRIAWKKTLSLTIDQPALVGEDGTLAIVTSRGDVVFLDNRRRREGPRHVRHHVGRAGHHDVRRHGGVHVERR